MGSIYAKFIDTIGVYIIGAMFSYASVSIQLVHTFLLMFVHIDWAAAPSDKRYIITPGIVRTNGH